MVIPKVEYTAFYVALKRIFSVARLQHEQDRHG